MSNLCQTWVKYKVRLGDRDAKHLIFMMADIADDSGVCWPNQKTLAWLTEMSLATVKRKIVFLETHGLIQVVRKRVGTHKTKNCYRLRIEKAFNLTGIVDAGKPLIPEELAAEILAVCDEEDGDEVEGLTLSPSKNDASASQETCGLQRGETVEGLTLSPSNQIDENPPEKHPGKVGRAQGDTFKGLRVTPLKGSRGAPNHHITINKNTTSSQTRATEFDSDPRSLVTMSPTWLPNRYISERLEFTKAIPPAFTHDAALFFGMHHHGQVRRQSAWERAFAGWVIRDWEIARYADRAEPRPITATWHPSPEALQAIEAQGVRESDALDIQLPAFLAYWLETGEARPSWNSLFIQHCVHHRQLPKGGQLVPGNQQGKSITERLASMSNRSWATA